MRRKDEMVELRERYLNGNRLIKREILDGLCTVHGYHRKAAIRHLNAEVNRLASGKPKRVGKRGRRSRYQGDPGFEAVLKAVWAETDYMCSTNLVKARHEWLPAYEEEYGTLRADIRERILTVSSSTIDRILKPYKYRGRGRCGTKPGALLRDQIPISTAVWDITEPGFLEGDTVAHCGGSLSGEFAWSLTATDICTTWTEVRIVWHKGTSAVVERIMEIRAALPFDMYAWNSDCGGEFVNYTLLKYFNESGTQFLRSRSYKKNDNAHVEQKNYTHVRQLLGYGRFDNPAIIEPLNELLIQFSILRNHFYPTRKLQKKIVVGGKTVKIFDTPATPYERVLAHPAIPDSTKQRLREHHASINPVKMRKQLKATLRQVLRLASVTPICDGSTQPSVTPNCD